MNGIVEGMAMGGRSLGMMLIGIGVLVVIGGVLVMTGALSWFGRLPGDIRIQSGSTRIYFPMMTMLVLSIALTVILAIVRRFF